ERGIRSALWPLPPPLRALPRARSGSAAGSPRASGCSPGPDVSWETVSLSPRDGREGSWEMAEVTVMVPDGVGLHARPAAGFVQAAARAPADITVGRPGGEHVNAKSILSVLALDVGGGEQIVLR